MTLSNTLLVIWEKKVRKVKIIGDIMYVLSFDSSIYVRHYMMRTSVTVHYFAALHLLNK